MPAPRHRAVKHRAPRRSLVERLPALPVVPAALRRRPPLVLAAGLATTAVLATTVSAALPDADTAPTAARAELRAEGTSARDTAQRPSRGGAERPAQGDAPSDTEALGDLVEIAPLTVEPDGGAQSAPELTASGRLWVTEDADLSTGPGRSYETDGDVAGGDRIAVTGQRTGDWSEVLVDDKPRWVLTSLLSEEEPGLSSAPCPTGSEVESGLQDATVAVHRAVCAEFPEVSTYGGMRSDGMHGRGQALDIMVSGATGDRIADFVRENAAELGVTEVIWQQRIWTTQRSSEGWRSMEDRGSTTANHFDHVHVTTG